MASYGTKPSFVRTLMNHFSRLDLFGQVVELKIAGHDRSQSFVGAIVSVACLALSIALSIPVVKQWIYKIDPTITNGFEYNTAFFEMNDENFFFAFGFFTPLSGVFKISNDTNNYTSLLNISDIKVNCPDCDFTVNSSYYDDYYQSYYNSSRRELQAASVPYKKPLAAVAADPPDFTNSNVSNNSFYLVNCNTSKFDDIKQIKSYSKKRSEDISAMLATYSFCFPPNYKANITDGADSTVDESIQLDVRYEKTLFIPDKLTTKFNQNGAIKATEVPDFGNIFQGSTNTNTNTGGDKPPAQQDQPSQQNDGSTNQPKDSGGTTQQPPQDGGSTTQQPQDSGGTTQQPPQDGGSTTQQPSSGGTTQQQQPQDGGTNQQQPPPQRLLEAARNPHPKRNTQLISQADANTGSDVLSSIDSTLNSFLTNDTLPIAIRALGKKNAFPKIIMLTHNVQILPKNSEEEILSLTYDLNMLNYYDITGNPQAFDVFVQKVSVIIETSKGLIPVTKNYTYLIAERVVENIIDIDNRDSAVFNFKIYSDSKVITIKYATFSDVLSEFGALFSVFSLIATVISSLYNEVFYREALINSIFEFVEHKHSSEFKKKTGKFKYKSNDEKSKEIETELTRIKPKLVGMPPGKDSADRSQEKEFSDRRRGTFMNIGQNIISSPSDNANQNGSKKIMSTVDQNLLENTDKRAENQPVNLSVIDLNKEEKLNLNSNVRLVSNAPREVMMNNYNDENSKKSSLGNSKSMFFKNEVVSNKSLFKEIKELNLGGLGGSKPSRKGHDENNITRGFGKKKSQMRRTEMTWIELALLILPFFRKFLRREKASLADKCLEVIDKYMDITTIIKNQFQLLFLRDLLLNPVQNSMFKYNFQMLNIDNYEHSNDYLTMLLNENQDVPLDELHETMEKKKEKTEIDRKLEDKFNEYNQLLGD